MAVADGLDGASAVEHLGRGGCVVVAGSVVEVGREDTAVVRAAGDDADAVRLAVGKELVEGGLLEEGVATGEQEAVEGQFAGETQLQLPLVHAGADRSHEALLAKLDEGGEGLADGLVGVVIWGVHEEDVDAVEAEALEAGLEGAQDAIAGEVEVPGLGAADVLLEEAPDLRRDDEAGAFEAGERAVVAALALAEAVHRGCVEVANAGLVGTVDERFRLGPRCVARKEDATQAKAGDAQGGAADLAGIGGFHGGDDSGPGVRTACGRATSTGGGWTRGRRGAPMCRDAHRAPSP